MSRAKAKTSQSIPGWNQLRHAGLLLDGARLHSLVEYVPAELEGHHERRLRQRASAVLSGVDGGDGGPAVSEFIAFVLERVCGFDSAAGSWERGSRVPALHGRRAITGEVVKPRQLWSGPGGASLPVFIDVTKRIGIGRGRRIVSQVLGWLRGGRRASRAGYQRSPMALGVSPGSTTMRRASGTWNSGLRRVSWRRR